MAHSPIRIIAANISVNYKVRRGKDQGFLKLNPKKINQIFFLKDPYHQTHQREKMAHSPIRTIATNNFASYQVRRGKDQSFSRLNPKERKLEKKLKDL